jgi:hypothetical protein
MAQSKPKNEFIDKDALKVSDQKKKKEDEDNGLFVDNDFGDDFDDDEDYEDDF